MKPWLRWIALAALTLTALGPGLFWSPEHSRAGSGFSQGWTAFPLPQPLLEAKSKLNPIGGGLLALAFGLVTRYRFARFVLRTPTHAAPIHRPRLYLIYARLQTDGG